MPKVTSGESDYFLVLFVDARHLDYSCTKNFIKTMRKHPDDWSKAGDVGHAWIYLKGKDFSLEGGHSGELGLTQAKYFDGVMNYMDFGYASPTSEQRRHPIDEPNPIKYLWETQYDGFFQKGPGRHRPTFAVRVDLTEAQFLQICQFIRNYNFAEYAITNHQCCTFVTQIAALAGLDLECETCIAIEPVLRMNGESLVLWRDPMYSKFYFASPDILEASMRKAVLEGKARKAR